MINSICGKIQLNRPLSDRLRSTEVCHPDIASRVVALLSASGPAAIRWFVISVIVLALDLQTDRLRAHVGVEILKRVSPALAHLDAPASPFWKLRAVWIVASLFDFDPRPVFWTYFSFQRMAVTWARFAAHGVIRLALEESSGQTQHPVEWLDLLSG